jgi:hypothetical protein
MFLFPALLQDLDWTKESALLQRNMALGDAKHRRQVRDLFHDIRQGLADCVFGYAAQSGLSLNDTLRLVDFLSKVKPGEAAAGATGALNNTTDRLTMALMYAVDIGALQKVRQIKPSFILYPLLILNLIFSARTAILPSPAFPSCLTLSFFPVCTANSARTAAAPVPDGSTRHFSRWLSSPGQ